MNKVQKRHYNWPLVIGLGLLLLLSVLLLFPELLTDKNPYALSMIQFWVDDNAHLNIATAPYPPGETYPIGSDQMGRDLVSFIAHGMKLTLLLAFGITVFRFILAIPIGIAAGMNIKVAQKTLHHFNTLLTTLPPLLLALLILRLDFFTSLYKGQSIIVFLLILTLVGWSKLGIIFEENTIKLMKETYILSEKAIGKSRLKIALEHIWPHMLPEAVVLFFMEIAQALTLMMQLGLFSIFVGNLKVIKDSAREGFSYFNVTFEPEWSSLLGTARDYIRVAPWIAISAGVAFFITVLAFNLVGEGLRSRFQMKHVHLSHPIRALKRPRTLAVLGIAGIVTLVSFWPDQYPWVDDVQSNSLPITGPVLSGSKTSEAVANRIIEHMKQLGIEPAGSRDDASQYTQTFEMPARLDIDNTSLTVSKNATAQSDPWVYGVDYVLLQGQNCQLTMPVVDATETLLTELPKSWIENKWLYVDTALLPASAVMAQLNRLENANVKGLILSSGIHFQAPAYQRMPVISLTASKAEELLSTTKSSQADKPVLLSLKIEGQSGGTQGRNLFGKLTGQEKTQARNTLIIGMDYSAATAAQGLDKLDFYLNLMSTLKAYSEKINRTLLFAFYDGDAGLTYYSEHALVQNQHVNLYMDLTDIESGQYQQLLFSDELSPISRYYGFVFSEQFRKNGQALISPTVPVLSDRDGLLFYNESLTTVHFKFKGHGQHSIDAFGEVFVKTLLENAY